MASTQNRRHLATTLLLVLFSCLVFPLQAAAGIPVLTLSDPVAAQPLERHLEYACTDADTGLEERPRFQRRRGRSRR